MGKGLSLFTIRELISITSGVPVNKYSAEAKIQSVSIDSRKIEKGSLFVALNGERVDGHAYLSRAAAAGASAVLVNLGSSKTYTAQMTELNRLGTAVIAVSDTLKALQKLAAAWVARHQHIRRVAVTGSNGKTTTKEMTAAILSQMGSTVKTPGNYNSEIGLPLSVFNMQDTHEFGVFEMGINHVGEMDTLIDIYRPEISIMTNIGTAHIGNFGNLEMIAREKSKIFHSGVTHGYIHEENIWKSYLRNLRGLEFCEFGRSGTEGFRGADYLGLQGWRIHYEDRHFRLRHVGIHNLFNALAAISVARDLGAEPTQIADGLESLEPMAGRGRILQGSVTVIEDCYNANVDSTSNIIDYMGKLSWSGRKAAVLGSMKELGGKTAKAHELIGRKVTKTPLSAAFLFGEEMESAYKVLKSSNSVNKLFFTDSFEELEQEVSSYVDDGDLFLLKGSRSMELERLLKSFGIAS